MPIPLVIIHRPTAPTPAPVADFIKQYREKHGSTVVTVYLPQYIVGHWWESPAAQPPREPHRRSSSCSSTA